MKILNTNKMTDINDYYYYEVLKHFLCLEVKSYSYNELTFQWNRTNLNTLLVFIYISVDFCLLHAPSTQFCDLDRGSSIVESI